MATVTGKKKKVTVQALELDDKTSSSSEPEVKQEKTKKDLTVSVSI